MSGRGLKLYFRAGRLSKEILERLCWFSLRSGPVVQPVKTREHFPSIA